MYTYDKPSEAVNYNSVFQSGKELAALLGVSPAAITSAVKNGHKCCGYPVAEWAEFSESGRTEGYHVPNYLVEQKDGITKNEEQIERANPESTKDELNWDLIKQDLRKDYIKQKNETAEKVEPKTVQQPNYSILPENQDYARPTTGLALSSTVNSALKQDTPQSRAVVTAGVTGLGALTGHVVSDSPKGAAIGAGIGLGVSFLMTWLDEQNKSTQQIPDQKKIMKDELIAEYVDKAKSSGYVN